MYPFRRILAATDFGPTSERAVDLSAALCASYGAQLTLIHVCSNITPIAAPTAMLSPPIESMEDASRRAMDHLLTHLRPRVASVQGVVRLGDACDQILQHAGELGADLIVMGTHGHRGFSRLLLGSVAEKTVRLADIPVLTIRGPQSAEVDEAAHEPLFQRAASSRV